MVERPWRRRLYFWLTKPLWCHLGVHIAESMEELSLNTKSGEITFYCPGCQKRLRTAHYEDEPEALEFIHQHFRGEG